MLESKISKSAAPTSGCSSVVVEEKEKGYFSMLPVGQGIVKLQDRWTKPFLVKFPLVNVNKGSISDDILARYSAVNLKKITESGQKVSVFPEFRRVPEFDNALNESAFSFLEDIWNNPNDGVRERYRRLSLSDYSGNRIKGELVDSGWVEGTVIELGNTRKFVTRLTKKGKEYLGLDSGKFDSASIVHEYWKMFWSQRFSEMGYRVQIEAERKSSGNVDVLATKNGRTTAIEVETGKSNIFKNIKENLLAGFDKLLIIATNEKAREKVERILAQEGFDDS